MEASWYLGENSMTLVSTFFIALHLKLAPIISAGSMVGRRENSSSFDQAAVLLVKESEVRDWGYYNSRGSRRGNLNTWVREVLAPKFYKWKSTQIYDWPLNYAYIYGHNPNSPDKARKTGELSPVVNCRENQVWSWNTVRVVLALRNFFKREKKENNTL